MPAPVAAAAAARTSGAGASRAGAGRAAAARRGAGKAAAVASTAAEQRAAIDAIKAQRPAEPPAPSTAVVEKPAADDGGRRRELPGVLTDQRGAPAAFRIDGLRAANTGGGFVLGLGAYAVGMAYLRGGKAEVKRLIRAKFFNQVGGP